MDLEFGTVRTRGRAAKPVGGTVVRELRESDFELLDGEKGVTAPAIKRLSERHHALARSIANGMKMVEAAALCGYDISRVSVLKSDPSFAELVEFYRTNVDAQYVEFHQALAGMSIDALMEIRRRIEDSPEDLSISALMDLLKIGADRTGYGPTTKQETNVTVNVAERLQAARQRAAERMIDVTPTKTEG